MKLLLHLFYYMKLLKYCNYLKYFLCTHLVGAKCQDHKENYLKVRNYSRHLASTCRFLIDRYVVFEIMLIALTVSVGFCQQLLAGAGCYAGWTEERL